MDFFWIQIGKAFSALRHDGALSALRKMTIGIWSIIQPFKSGQILFISGGTGDSARYRTEHPAEFLRNNDIKASYTVQNNIFLNRYVDDFQIFVFHRVMWTPKIDLMIRLIKKQKKTIIFETDDLVFDEKYIQHMAVFQKMNAFEKKQYEKGVGVEILNDPYVQFATTSTLFLQHKLEQRGKKVFLLPNMLSKKDAMRAKLILKKKREQTIHRDVSQEKEECPVYIGYFSGTKSHDKDFAYISEALQYILEKYPFTQLVIAGPLVLEDAFARFSERIIRLPFTSRSKHFENISHIDINIAPLEIGNPFCEGKSELKFFEAGIVEVPTIASATQTYRDAITQGKDGFIATSKKDWIDHLSLLIEDKSLRYSMGKEARKTIVKKYTTSSDVCFEYLKFIQSVL